MFCVYILVDLVKRGVLILAGRYRAIEMTTVIIINTEPNLAFDLVTLRDLHREFP